VFQVDIYPLGLISLELLIPFSSRSELCDSVEKVKKLKDTDLEKFEKNVVSVAKHHDQSVRPRVKSTKPVENSTKPTHPDQSVRPRDKSTKPVENSTKSIDDSVKLKAETWQLLGKMLSTDPDERPEATEIFDYFYQNF